MKIFTFFIGLAMVVMLNAQTNNSGFRAVVEELPRPIYDQHPEFVDLYYKAWELAYFCKYCPSIFPGGPYRNQVTCTCYLQSSIYLDFGWKGT